MSKIIDKSDNQVQRLMRADTIETDGAPAAESALATARRDAMAVLARAHEAELADAFASWTPPPEVTDLRRPECGLAMVRGRIGGDGAPFNLGEATVTRAAVRLASGTVGHAYLLGRAPTRARLAAVFDALWQEPATRARVEAGVLARVRARLMDEDRRVAEQTAATRVQFFTVARGEDAQSPP